MQAAVNELILFTIRQSPHRRIKIESAWEKQHLAWEKKHLSKQELMDAAQRKMRSSESDTPTLRGWFLKVSFAVWHVWHSNKVMAAQEIVYCVLFTQPQSPLLRKNTNHSKGDKASCLVIVIIVDGSQLNMLPSLSMMSRRKNCYSVTTS